MKNMLKCDKELCTGCAACANICEYGALQMVFDEKGFLYPHINEELCVACNQCQEICPINVQNNTDNLADVKVYAMKSRDMDIRLHSTSGGAFSELAQVILNKGGCIVGAAYTQDWSVEHRIVCDMDQLEEIRRSKYQQSNIGLVYRQVKEVLLNKQDVLFCGTPCQAAGLKAYLGKEYSNLYICDFICRGVPSPGIFQSYIKDLQEQYGSEVTSVWMKNKRNGWHSLTTAITFANGEEYVRSGYDDTYVQLFLKYNVGIRPSCFQCQFKGKNSISDITLGDFWGLEGTEMDDNLGTSCVLCRTEKGKRLFEQIKDNVIYCEMELDDMKQGNPCFHSSVENICVDGDEENFYETLNNQGYQQAFRILKHV